MDSNTDFTCYRVEVCSVPGMYAQYSGVTHVWATNEEDAMDRSFRELRRTSFPDRSRDMWRVVSVTPLE